MVATVIFIGLLVLAYFLFRSMSVVNGLKAEAAMLQKQNKYLNERVEVLNLAERITHLGSWEVFVESRQVKWSEELYRVYGFKNDDFLPDASINEQVIAPEYREKVAKELKSAVENKTSFAVEYQIIQPSGARKYVLGQGFYIEGEAKLVGTIQDVTELKEAVLKLKINESLLREAEMVSHSGSWEWVDGKEFILWSDEMYNIHGFLPHSVFVNFAFYKALVHEDDIQFFMDNFYKAKQDKTLFKINYRIVLPSGEIRHVLTTAEYKRIGLNNNYAYIGNTQDVTQLREAQVQLEEKVVELNRSNQDLEQFAYVASHDLQEPLRKIQAFGDRLKDKYAGQMNEEAQDYIGRMRGASERMRALIDDLLTFSKLTRGNKSFTKLRLTDIVSKTLSDLDFIIEAKKATVKIDLEDDEIEGVESQLMQLFQNLIGNSLKFTNQNESPCIEMSCSMKYGYDLNIPEANRNHIYCVVEVKDNGIGFETEDALKIFDIFHRLHSRADYEGTGIGLAICKRIADNHSGFISAESRPGNGAAFVVILPKKQNK
ncbi:PAS domain-containing protein [Pedobacter foliorum]|uniref:sensor histidine kinase n=1 Tax=Pedobacter foliorum TaxID=2739058 RepID=UPI0015668820|nr:PAS domain-containing sensor histidine kinase [Pedobacter foliorum]NRF41940.1 PAS domain-containing protein [Pedobacter foliorum]